MRKFHWIAVCVVLTLQLTCAFPVTSHALPESPRRHFSTELRWGYYVMDTSKVERSVFGRKYAIVGGAKLNLDLFREVIQVGAGAGYMREHEPFYYLYNIPVEASLNVRLKFSHDQLIVPYVGGGVDYSYFKQRSTYLDANDVVQESALHNNRKGYHVNVGAQLLLNGLSPESAKRFDSKFGVNATYLTFEARYTDLGNFGKLKENQTDMSGWFYYMGILFEF